MSEASGPTAPPVPLIPRREFNGPAPRDSGRHERWLMNQKIVALDRSIATATFPDFVYSVDDICSENLAWASERLGACAAKLFLLKIANLLIAKYEYINRHITLISHPVGLLVDPCNGCSLRCPGCVHSGLRDSWDWPSGLLKEETFQKFLDEHGPFANELYLANYGEPLLNSLTPRFVRFARQYGLPTFSSTSLSIPSRLLNGLVESGLNFLILSIDGASEEIYSKYRRNGNFRQVLGNVKRLVETKRRLGSYTPVLHWQFLVFEHNIHEVEKVTDLARDLGVNELALVRPFSVTWDDPAVRAVESWESETVIFEHDRPAYLAHLSKLRCDLAEATIDRQFAISWAERMSRRPVRAAELRRSSSASNLPKPCNWLYKSLTMDARGRIMPCARPPTKHAKERGDLVFARHTSVEHFNSRMHRLARQMFANESIYRDQVGAPGAAFPHCEKCKHRDQKGDIDTRVTVRRLLGDVDLYALLDEESRNTLTDW
jgi:MoaA/NifB/PqqE/SkfB family radical SAM enzyme